MNSTYFMEARSNADALVNVLFKAGNALADYVHDEPSHLPYSLQTHAQTLADRFDENSDHQELICDYRQFEILARASAVGLRAEIDRIAPEENASVAGLAVESVRAAAGLAGSVADKLTNAYFASQKRPAVRVVA